MSGGDHPSGPLLCFQTATEKPTTFLQLHLSLEHLGPFVDFLTRHMCRSWGLLSSGGWTTKVAEPCPMLLTKELAPAFENAELSLLAQEFEQRMQ